jgi:hypothetical protein
METTVLTTQGCCEANETAEERLSTVLNRLKALLLTDVIHSKKLRQADHVFKAGLLQVSI